MKKHFVQSVSGVSFLAIVTLLSVSSRLLTAAPRAGERYIPLQTTSTQQTAGEQPKPSGPAVLEFAPMAYFESNCARCHGAYGSFYGEGFGRGLTDSKLRQVVHDMAAGPGNAPVTEPQLDALTAYHRSFIDGRPFLIVNAANKEQDGSHTLKGETTPESQISLQWEGGTATATVQDYTWSATLPANVDWSKVEIIARKDELQTVFKSGQSEYSHRESLDKTASDTQNESCEPSVVEALMIRHRYLPFLLVAGLLLAVSAYRLRSTSSVAPQRRVVGPNMQPRVPPPVLQWRAATAAERRAVIAVVTAQLDAFRANDFRKAATYQSNALRANFGSVENFRKAIRGTYPQFASYKKARFGEARADTKGTRVALPITLTGRDGVTVQALYLMELENKLYRVAGVQGGIVAPGRQPGTPRNGTPLRPPAEQDDAPSIAT